MSTLEMPYNHDPFAGLEADNGGKGVEELHVQSNGFVIGKNYLVKGLYTSILQWVLDYPNLDYPYPDIWTLGHVRGHVAMFL